MFDFQKKKNSIWFNEEIYFVGHYNLFNLLLDLFGVVVEEMNIVRH